MSEQLWDLCLYFISVHLNLIRTQETLCKVHNSCKRKPVRRRFPSTGPAESGCSFQTDPSGWKCFQRCSSRCKLHPALWLLSRQCDCGARRQRYQRPGWRGCPHRAERWWPGRSWSRTSCLDSLGARRQIYSVCNKLHDMLCLYW